MITLSDVISILYPNSSWICIGEDYSGLEWYSQDIPKPTREQVEAKIQELKAAEPMRLLRVHRDKLIAETDWWVLPDRTPTQEQLNYRQSLRDLPETASPVLDPTSPTGISGVDWPVKP